MVKPKKKRDGKMYSFRVESDLDGMIEDLTALVDPAATSGRTSIAIRDAIRHTWQSRCSKSKRR